MMAIHPLTSDPFVLTLKINATVTKELYKMLGFITKMCISKEMEDILKPNPSPGKKIRLNV